MITLTGIPVLETERLILRGPVAADAEAFVAYYTSPRTQFVGGPKPAPLAYEKFCALIGHWSARGFGRFVIEPRALGFGIGHVGPLWLDTGELVEMTWTLWEPRFEGKGYATEAARAVMDWLRGAMGMTQMRTAIHRDNLGSERIAERLGGVRVPGDVAWLPGAGNWHFDLTGDMTGGAA